MEYLHQLISNPKNPNYKNFKKISVCTIILIIIILDLNKTTYTTSAELEPSVFNVHGQYLTTRIDEGRKTAPFSVLGNLSIFFKRFISDKSILLTNYVTNNIY